MKTTTYLKSSARILTLALSLWATNDLQAQTDDIPAEGGGGTSTLIDNVQDMLLEPQTPADGGASGIGGGLGDLLGTETTPPNGGDGEGAVPVDGGISLLLAAGVAYGVRRHRKSAAATRG